MLNESVSAAVSATTFDMRLMAPVEPAKPIGDVLAIRHSSNLITEFDEIVARYYADDQEAPAPTATDPADEVLHWMDRVRAMPDSPSVIAARAHALRHWFAKHWWDVPAKDRDLEFEHATHLIESILARRDLVEASVGPLHGVLVQRDPGTGLSVIENAAAEWAKCVAFINTNKIDDSPEELATVERQRELEAFLSETPARDFGDLQAKALVIKQLASPEFFETPFEGDDVETLTWSLVNDIVGDGQNTVAIAVEDPAATLWADWYRRISESTAASEHLHGKECDRFYDDILDIQGKIVRDCPHSVERLCAEALIELYHTEVSLASTVTLTDVSNRNCGDPAGMAYRILAALRPQLLGPMRDCADELLDNPDVPLMQNVLHRETKPMASVAFLQAAE